MLRFDAGKSHVADLLCFEVLREKNCLQFTRNFTEKLLGSEALYLNSHEKCAIVKTERRR